MALCTFLLGLVRMPESQQNSSVGRQLRDIHLRCLVSVRFCGCLFINPETRVHAPIFPKAPKKCERQERKCLQRHAIRWSVGPAQCWKGKSTLFPVGVVGMAAAVFIGPKTMQETLVWQMVFARRDG